MPVGLGPAPAFPWPPRPCGNDQVCLGDPRAARRTAEDLAAGGSSEAEQISRDLQPGTFPDTVAEAVEDAICAVAKQPSNLDTALGIPPFGTIAVLLMAPLLASGGVDRTAGVVLACQNVGTTGSASKFIAQNLEEVMAAISAVEEAGEETSDALLAMQALEKVIASSDDVTFTGNLRERFSSRGTKLDYLRFC